MSEGAAERLPARQAGGPPAGAPPAGALRHQRIALVDLLDRVLAGGVVIKGEVRLAIADVDLVTVSLQALISSVATVAGEPPPAGAGPARPDGGADDHDR